MLDVVFVLFKTISFSSLALRKHTRRHMVFVIQVHVRADNVPVGPQAYALVVTGKLQELPAVSCANMVACPNDCSLQGTCQVRIVDVYRVCSDVYRVCVQITRHTHACS